MALKGIDYFKVTPKTNCKACGKPTCMAFGMDVAAGKLTIDKCPHIKPDDLAKLSEASAPPMKTITVGAGKSEHKIGGETVLFRHLKTFVSRCLYGVNIGADPDKEIAAAKKVDYERISERMYVEVFNIEYTGDKAKFLDAVKKANNGEQVLILTVSDPAVAKEALDIAKAGKPILNGANAGNVDEFNKLATEAGVTLGVSGKDINEIYDTLAKLEAAGNKNLIVDVGTASIKEAFSIAVDLRRAAIGGNDRTAGYPSIVNVGKLSGGCHQCQVALATLFTLKYGSIILLDSMSYAQALPLYGLRQNIFTDPQKPMRVNPEVIPLNGADENAVNLTTVDFALSYFVIRGEIERSKVPANLIITDAGGYSVLTAWAAGKLTAGSIAKYVKENWDAKSKNKTLVLPGKVSVLKGELEEALPGWKILIGPTDAIGVVKFLKDLK